MKFIWEAEDITVGRKYSKNGIAEVWLIGFLPEKPSDSDRYVSISLSDGLVTKSSSKSDLAKLLSTEGYVPVEYLAAKGSAQ